jgi:hypothetical protein
LCGYPLKKVLKAIQILSSLLVFLPVASRSPARLVASQAAKATAVKAPNEMAKTKNKAVGDEVNTKAIAASSIEIERMLAGNAPRLWVEELLLSAIMLKINNPRGRMTRATMAVFLRPPLTACADGPTDASVSHKKHPCLPTSRAVGEAHVLLLEQRDEAEKLLSLESLRSLE